MKKEWVLFISLIGSVFSVCGQDCSIQLRADTFICGYATNLYAFPPGGAWSVDCSAAPGPVDFFQVNDTTTSLTVTQCGTYPLHYTVLQVDTTLRLDTVATTPGLIIDTTLVVDTLCASSGSLTLSFDTPGQAIFDLLVDVTVAYPASTCPGNDTIYCRKGIPALQEPDPLWTFVIGGLCNSSRLTAEVSGVEDCVAEQILFQSENLTGTILDTIEVPQSTFLQTDPLTGAVLVNEFPAAVRQAALQAIQESEEGCPIPISCDNAPLWCYDTLYDTTTVVLPARIAGQWLFHPGAGEIVTLQDTTAFIREDSLYLAVARPSARVYSANFDFFQVNYLGDTIPATPPGGIALQWTEEWGFDTVTEVSFSLVDTCCGGGLNLRTELLGQPEPPVYDCPPAGYVFLPELAAEVSYPLCQDSVYRVRVDLSGGRPPYQFEGVSGILTDSVFLSDTLSLSESYSLFFSDQGDCSLRLSSDACSCVGLAATTPDTAFLDCRDHCVTLEGSAMNNLGLPVELEWKNTAGALLAEGSSLRLCDTAIAFFVAREPVSGCGVVNEVVVLDGQPVADAGGPYVLNCVNTSFRLGGSNLSLGERFTYQWSGPGISDSISMEPFPEVDAPGLYMLIVTGEGEGCIDSAQVEAVDDRITFSLSPEPSCLSGPTGRIFVEDISGGRAPYVFLLNGTSGFSDPIIDNVPEGRHRVYVKSSDGCLAFKEVEVGAAGPFSLSLQEEYPVCGDTLEIDATVDSQGLPVDYIWEGRGERLRGAVQQFDKGGQWHLRVATRCQTLEAQFTITDKADFERYLVFPGAFTPNGDGHNDLFLPVQGAQTDVEDYHLLIFNRFGNKVFESRGPEVGWDGTIRGKPAPSEVYFWIARGIPANCDNIAGELIRQGDVTLIR